MDPPVQGTRPPVKTLIFPSADAIHRRPEVSADVPDDRPSERPTRPTLPPPEDPSDESMELSVRDFVDDDSSAKASTLRPPSKDRPPPPSWLLPALRIAAAALFLLVAIAALMDSPTVIVAREPRVAWPDRVVLADAPASGATPIPPGHGCIAVAPPRFVAPRASINVGLDVSSSATSTGFVVALASANDEASAVRLEGTNLRNAETVRLRPSALSPIRRVVARDIGEDSDTLDLRADTDDARTIVPEGDAPVVKVGIAGAFVVARVHDRTHSLWPLPAFSKDPRDHRVDALRVAARDDGGAVVVLKRGNTLYLGVVNGALSAMGPLLTIARPSATIGTPFVIANGGGAALAWAERANGAREWTIIVASLGGGETETKAIGAGISPSIAALPDGTLVVAYADGPAASHRIVVRRLAADLTPSSEIVVASPEHVNAGQPVIDVRADGRALVAWLAVSRGQPAAVYATPLQCDVSTSM